jgi:hypothetical protein
MDRRTIGMMKPMSMIDAANKRQEEFENRRRTRLLGLAIDQSLQGVKNIITYTDPKFWHEDHKDRCIRVKEFSINVLQDLMKIERQLLELADIYVSMIPVNQELRSFVSEDPTQDKN